MAERFYSIHPDDTVFMSYNAAQQQQQQHQQLVAMAQQPPGIAMAAAGSGGGGGDFDYLRSYRPPLQPSSCNMMAQYAAGSGGSFGLVGGMPPPPPLSGGVAASTATGGCHYAHANGNASCYTRNRYMPYSHNRACAAAAAATQQSQQHHQHNNNSAAAAAAMQAAAISTSCALTYPYQQFAPIYQSCPSIMAAPVSAATAAAVAATATQSTSATVAPLTSADGSFNYAHSVISSTGGVSCSTNSGGGGGVSSSSGIMKLLSASQAGSTAITTASSQSSTVSSVPVTSSPYSAAVAVAAAAQSYPSSLSLADPSQTVTLQITNLDYWMDEASLRNFLMHQLKPITPVVSLVFEGNSYAKVTVPDLFFAKQVVSNLHRKKIGHKRMLVSYTRDSSLTEINTLRCQVAGLLKDVPYYTLPMYKFRELFQSRFKTSISVLDLYKMPDICTINADNTEEKFISLQPELISSLESSPLMEGLQHSVPYCTIHFKREQDKGWAEQDIEPLPNVCMTIAEIQQIIYPLLKSHPGDIPINSLVHCIEAELKIQISANESGVNLEHLVCCVQGIQIQVNNFGIKILGWLELDKDSNNNGCGGANINGGGGGSVERGGLYSKQSITDPLNQIAREVVELVKMSPKSTMKFHRFIPAYHNHFGKQCRVADYGYTKLVELFEALPSVVQIIGDGENRQITLTHRTQIRRFTSDLLRVLRAHGNKSVLLSQLPLIFEQTQNRSFDVTDYGVCDISDILDGLVNSNIVVVATVQSGKDMLISIPKRKQTSSEVEKTAIFAGEMVELFRNAPQYTIHFQKFVRSYHYHFAYQCRLSDYGFLKLADLMEAIHGVVEMRLTNDEDKTIYLSARVARRVFAEQCEELIRGVTGSSKTCMKLDDVLKLHKKKFGYKIQPQTLGVKKISEAIELLPYVEVFERDESTWLICHNEDAIFRTQCYRACKHLLAHEAPPTPPPSAPAAAPTPATAPAAATEDTTTTTKTATKEVVSPTVSTKKSTPPEPLTVASFISEFNTKHKENVTENTVKAMKHAIEIIGDGDNRRVQISAFMKFLVNVVRLLDQRPTMLLHEIKNALNCSITTTFEFGYPNLFTLLAAYPDVFSVNLGVSQERSDVSLLPNSELRLASSTMHQQHLFGSLKLPMTKLKTTTTRATSRPSPLGEHNSRVNGGGGGGGALQGPPPAKTRAISSDAASFNNMNYRAYATNNNNNNNYYQPQQTSLSHKTCPHHLSLQSQCLSCSLSFSSSASSAASACSSLAAASKLYPTLSSHTNSSGSSIYSTASHYSTMLNTSASNLSNKENSSGSSFNASMIFNASFNSSASNNTSMSELNSSMSGGSGSGSGVMGLQPAAPPNYGSSSSNLWDRRHSSTFYQQQPTQQQQQQQQQQLLATSNNNSALLAGLPLPPLVMPSPQSSQQQSLAMAPLMPPGAAQQNGFYELVSSIQMCPMYEPPKPDTPPSENMPFWIDPIWANNGIQLPKNDLLNIKLPELKSLNVLPMLLSPYTLSKTENMKQQVFNFENHDRKIA